MQLGSFKVVNMISISRGTWMYSCLQLALRVNFNRVMIRFGIRDLLQIRLSSTVQKSNRPFRNALNAFAIQGTDWDNSQSARPGILPLAGVMHSASL